jgi:putative acetyltransferase
MSEHISIRQETQEDYKEVFEVVGLAFGQDNEAKLVDALRNNSSVFVPQLSVVATNNSNIVGHILFTKINIVNESNRESESLALAPISVRPEYQRKGIGSKLINYGLDAARALQFSSVIVLGHAHYYPKFGFLPAEKWSITSRYNVPSNVFMALELVPNGLQNINGLVKYPKEFESL